LLAIETDPSAAEFRPGRRPRRALPAVLAVLLLTFALAPASAFADGPTTPIATSYIARLTHVPAGLDAKVVDGDLQMWLKVPPTKTVIVLDYLGAPWVRFDRAGVDVNQNSEMYYLSQTPVPETVPAGLSRTTPPHWDHVSGGHSFLWHDGRLHALTTVAIAPGTSFVGPWQVRVLVNGQPTVISGSVFYDGGPSIVWFWPIVVLLACVLAAWRVRRPAIDLRLARTLALVLLAAFALGGAGRELHGQPTVTAGQLLVLAAMLAFVAYCLWRVLSGRTGYFLLFVIAFAALWSGGIMLPTLLHGYVLLAIPAFLARATTVVLLGGGLGLILVSLRVVDQTSAARPRRPPAPAAERPLAHT
jgi:hypothetical protein